MSTSEKSGSILPLAAVVFVVLILAVLASFTRFVFAKDYFFHIETTCDETTENCYIRSCDDYCPPNGLESYKVFQMPATEYRSCIDNMCTNVCVEGNNTCLEIPCDPEVGDACSI